MAAFPSAIGGRSESSGTEGDNSKVRTGDIAPAFRLRGEGVCLPASESEISSRLTKELFEGEVIGDCGDAFGGRPLRFGDASAVSATMTSLSGKSSDAESEMSSMDAKSEECGG